MSDINWQQVKDRLAENETFLSQKVSRDIVYWQDLLERRAQQLAVRTPPEQNSSTTYLACLVQGEKYALNLNHLKEIHPFRECTFLPLAPPALLGVFNQRGTLVSVLDLAILLNLNDTAEKIGGYLLFLRTHPPLGLRVDQILDLIHLEDEQISTSHQAPYLKGLAFGELQILDIPRLWEHPLLQGENRQTEEQE